MTVVIDGTLGISPVTPSGTSSSIDGMTVGRGGGEISTNTAVGTSALVGNTTGLSNDAFGLNVLGSNNGSYNSSFGRSSLTSNTSGSYNTAVGNSALALNTIASSNTAVGYQAGYTNITGTANTFTGYQAGYTSNATAANGYNTATGYQAGKALTTGIQNSFFGFGSGQLITSGGKNTIVGAYDGNTGGLDIRTSSNYIVLSDGDGNPRARWDSNGQGYTVGGGNGSYAFQILNGGNSTPYGLYMQFTGSSPNNTSQYYLNCSDSTTDRFRIYSNGTYGSVSDARLKKNIETSRGYLSDLCQLRVVKYGWATNDDSVPKELGFIAQEVEEIFPSLVDNSGEYKMIKQPVLIPMLIKAIQELKAEFDAYKEAHP
jgi:trimeric autotransporter adhesin